MQLSHLLAFALSLATSEAVYQGFNYGATNSDGSVKAQADFKSEFATAKALVGTPGFNSARLYTMIQGGSTNTPISAIPAAIEENTSLLLGIWASGGGVDNEIAALKNAISQYGSSLGKLVVGISVGSEDLYRNSVDGVNAKAGVGLNPDQLASYISQVRSVIQGTPLSGASIGHVDTWTAWTNGSNSAVIQACDWLGFDGYPYFQNTMANSINDGKSLFDDAVAKTKSVAAGKEVWITETGWPLSGSQQNLAVASVTNAKQYWDQVGCPLFGKTNTWWYTLFDGGSSPSFGVVGSTLSTNPAFDLSCGANSSSSAVPSSTRAPSQSTPIVSPGAASTSIVSPGAASTSVIAAGGVAVSSPAPGASFSGLSSSSSFGTAGSASSTPLASATKAPGAGASAGGVSSGAASSGAAGGASGSAAGSSASGAGSPSTPAPTAFNSASRLSGSVFAVLTAVLAVVFTL